jgi:hypothetical protein
VQPGRADDPAAERDERDQCRDACGGIDDESGSRIEVGVRIDAGRATPPATVQPVAALPAYPV